MRKLSTLLAAVCGLSLPAVASAADIGKGWGEWWLPPNHSAHGGDIDSLFAWIFWITMITFIGVEVVLVVFLIKYRYRTERKAIFTHGNTRLEMAWTLAPAVILAVLALASKKVWDNFRYAPAAEDPHRAQLLVIGEQFKWNIIYPGPDGKIGRYLMWPKRTDERWSCPTGQNPETYTFAGVKGPADLPPDKVVEGIKGYIDQDNPLGKDFSDPDGADDIWAKKAGTQELVLPKNRPIEVQLSSKDVIHDFFLPNFRVKLDAVPGMRGHIYFTAVDSSTAHETATMRQLTPDELVAAVNDPANAGLSLIVNEKTGGEFYKPKRPAGAKAFWRLADADKNTIAKDGDLLSPDLAKDIKTAGLAKVTVYMPFRWELVCEELCGANHYTMRNVVRIVESDEYDAMKLDKAYQPPHPSMAAAVGR